MKKNTIILTALSVLAAGGLANAQNSGTIAYIESNVASGTAGVNVSPDPIVTYIASQPGTGDGYTYGNWSILVQDNTGALDLFGHLPAGSSYTPAVGDAVNATGTYSPFDGIPEIETLTAIGADSTGNTVPAAPIYGNLSAIPTPLAVPSPTPPTVSGYLINVDDVTILNTTGNADFPTHANGTYTIEDGSGNTMELYQWASSYSTAGALGGTLIPTGPVNIVGLVDEFSGSPELIPFGITPASTPEPTTLALATMGGGALLMALRRRK